MKSSITFLISQSLRGHCSGHFMTMSQIIQSKKFNVVSSLRSTAKEYCEVCSPHGFSYWVTSKRKLEKLFWVGVVIVCFAISGYFVKTATEDWRDNPTQTTINALGIPITSLDHPAITICKPNGIYDIGEYLRAHFNNFQFSCKSSRESESCESANLLRNHFLSYSKMKGNSTLFESSEVSLN